MQNPTKSPVLFALIWLAFTAGLNARPKTDVVILANGDTIHGEGIVSSGADLPLLHGGLDRPRVGAGDAAAEADDLVIEHEPGLFSGESNGDAFELQLVPAVFEVGDLVGSLIDLGVEDEPIASGAAGDAIIAVAAVKPVLAAAAVEDVVGTAGDLEDVFA